MQQMRFDEVRSLDKIAHQARLVVDRQLSGSFECRSLRPCMGYWTHATNSLSDVRRITRVTTNENRLEASERSTAGTRGLNYVVFDVEIDSKVPFDPNNRIQCNGRVCHVFTSRV